MGLSPPANLKALLGYLNVRNYGALGNGSHDDTAAIQRCLSHAATAR